jgi:hypothetical protein
MQPRAVVVSILLALGLCAIPPVADAQQPGKVPTIGYLSQFSGAAGPQSLRARSPRRRGSTFRPSSCSTLGG